MRLTAILLMLFLPLAAAAQDRVAMVIGISAYEDAAPLDGPRADAALLFSRWDPECALKDGPFGARIPQIDQFFEPEILIVPLVAFDRQGGRLGYGGGFYDRTLEGLRQRRRTLAIGFAYCAQEAKALPLEPTDQPLDMIVTEQGVIEL